MPSIRVTVSNLLWMASSYPSYRYFHKALSNPRKTQESILQRILHQNKDTEFGKVHNFSSIDSVRSYQTSVPIIAYDTLAPYVERVCNGEQNVLTKEAVLLFEKTSGSSSAAKYIPYTDSLRREYQNALQAWVFDLYRNDLGLSRGRSYWMITPLGRGKEVTGGGIPVGFENDVEYLGAFEKRIAEYLFAVPREIAQVGDLDASLYLTLRFLLEAEDLTLISVWNPSYLTILMDRLRLWLEPLLEDLQVGAARWPSNEPLSPVLSGKLHSLPKRSKRLQRLLKEHGHLTAKDIWPQLRLISCWKDASAKNGLSALEKYFPGVRIQGKGLFATEGVMTIPWMNSGGSLPALTSHFYEFLPPNGGVVKLVHELQKNEEYSLLITTGGGLYRYQIGDRVRVTGFFGEVPVLEFIGRDDGVCDLQGEKLSQSFTQASLDDVLSNLAVSFAMLAPQDHQVPGYVLFIESPIYPNEIGKNLDVKLRTNPHYDYCRSLGQLAPLRVFWISGGAQNTYLRRCTELGQRSGTVKPTSLHSSSGWENVFSGVFVSELQSATGSC